MASGRRVPWGFGALALVAVGLVLWVVLRPDGGKPPAGARTGPPPVAVSVARATVQDVPVSISALGAAQAWRSVNIVAQVGGKLLSVPFKEGGEVKQGQVLAQIDPAPYRAALAQAQGVLARDTAVLDNARLDLARVTALRAQDSVSRQAADTQAALVRQEEGIVQSDRGAVDAAAVNLRFTTLTAPMAGRVGVRLVDPGNVVAAGAATPIVVVNQIEPIAVTFTVPQGDFSRLAGLSDGFRKPLAVEALAQETGASLGTGVLSIADNRVDPATGTVQLKARFDNHGHALWPGQYVNVRLTLQTLRGVITVPAAAVNQGPMGAFAYVIAGGAAQVRPVTVTAHAGDLAVIAAGLRPGETVVTDGQLTLRPGSKVRVREPGPAPTRRRGGA